MVTMVIWMLGFIVAFSSPTGIIPDNLGASMAGLSITAGIYLALQFRKATLNLEEYLLLLGAAFLSLSPVINTNLLVVYLSFAGWFCALSLIVLRQSESSEVPENLFAFLRGIRNYWLIATGMLIKDKTYRLLFKSTLTKPYLKGNRSIVLTFIASTVLLLIFHLLFSMVNQEYSQFIEDTFVRIWNIIVLIIDIKLIFKTILFAIIASGIFRTITETAPVKADAAKVGLKFSLLLGPIILLFGVFSIFQGKLIFISPSSMPFKELSLYTQGGFWQLLIAAFIGYAVWLFTVRRRSQDQHSNLRLLNLMIYIFAIELIIIAIFTAHKISLLQYYFGTKDTRIAATIAVTLIGLTFILNLFRMLNLLDDRRIFAFQYRTLGFVFLLLTFINLDQFVTNFHPIRHQVEGRWQKDYSYLFKNSFDNYSSWLSLMAEAKQTGINYPADYYWGSYSSLCNGISRYSTQSVDNISFPLKSKWRGLLNKYSDNLDLRNFNLREYLAASLLYEHSAEVNSFYIYIEEQCKQIKVS